MEKAGFSRGTFVDCPAAETEAGYPKFLDFMLDYADGFTLSFQKLGHGSIHQDVEMFYHSRWGCLADSVTGCEYTHESPVTTGPEVILLYFRFDDVTREFLKARRDIYDFAGYDFIVLWDLAFLKDGKIFCISCTHEKFCTIDEDVWKKFQQANK